MEELPKHISDALSSKTTSLGDSPAMPPSDEFVRKLVSSYFASVSEGIPMESTNELVSDLNKLVSECQGEERTCRPALEKLCSDIVSDMFEIPEDTIRLEIDLTDTVDDSDYRLVPEEDDAFEFEDIEDMKGIGAEINKRRMINALIEGASESKAYDVQLYVKELFDINPSLPSLYLKIIRYSQYLMYTMDEKSLENGTNDGGGVKVMMKPAPDMLEIKAEATLFPVLLQNTIKGILELSVLQGLPDDKEKAYYVMKKADYKMAEVWDSRIGVPLWKRVEECMEDCPDIGLNFLFMELSMLPANVFNELLQEVFVGTKRGKEMLMDLCRSVENKKDEEDFNDYIAKNNDRYPIEDGFFTEDELSADRPIGY